MTTLKKMNLYRILVKFSTVPEYFQFAVKVLLEILDIICQGFCCGGHLRHLSVQGVHLSSDQLTLHLI